MQVAEAALQANAHEFISSFEVRMLNSKCVCVCSNYGVLNSVICMYVRMCAPMGVLSSLLVLPSPSLSARPNVCCLGGVGGEKVVSSAPALK